MTLIPTMSAVTAAYASQAIKPSIMKAGEGATDEAITLLSARPTEETVAVHAAFATLRAPAALSLMLSSPDCRHPQGSRREAVERYREFGTQDDELSD